MALRAGRVGVNPVDVDSITGHITAAGGSSYSEDETVVGAWIDGSPIYRKVISFNIPTSPSDLTPGNITIPVENVNKVVNIDFILETNASFRTGNPLVNLSASGLLGVTAYYLKNDNGVFIQNNIADWSNRPCLLIIDYTK